MIQTMAVPVYNDNNEIIGVLFQLADGAKLSNMVNEIKFGTTGSVFMINSKGVSIANKDTASVLAQTNLIDMFSKSTDYAAFLGILQTAVKGGTAYDEYEYAGTKMCVAYTDLEGYDWHVMMTASYDEIYAEAISLRGGMLVMSVCMALLFSAIGIVVALFIAKPITKVSNALDVLATGDFTGRLDDRLLKSKDEVGSLARALHTTQASLITALTEVKTQSQAVTSNANEQTNEIKNLINEVQSVSAASEELSATSEEIASSAAQMSSSTEEAQNAIESIADRARGGATTAQEIDNRAETLKKTSQTSQASAKQMCAETSEKLQKAIEESKRVSEIDQLSNAILSITSQTNLLALNASIEAARAGEAGRGFAVVASEIGKLADDSQKSVSQIMEVTESVVSSVENLSKCAEQILGFINDTVLPDYDKQVSTGVQYSADASEVKDLVNELSSVSEEMFATMTSLVTSIKEVSCATEESAKGATNVATSSTEISKQTEAIASLAENTRESTEALEKAIDAFKLN